MNTGISGAGAGLGLGARIMALRVAQLLVTVWALFWAWFAAACAVSEGGVTWVYGGSFLVASMGLGTLAWWRPRLGGIALILAAAWAFTYFHGEAARGLLVLPALALGMMLSLLGSAREHTGSIAR